MMRLSRDPIGRPILDWQVDRNLLYAGEGTAARAEIL